MTHRRREGGDAPRPRVPRRAVLLLLALVCVLAAPPALAQEGDDPEEPGGEGAPADPVAPADPPVEIVSQTTWVRPDGDVRLVLDVNGAETDDHLSVSLHSRLRGRYELDDSFAARSLGRRLRSLADATVAELDADADGRIELRLGLRANGSADADRLLLTEEGLHPVVVDVFDAEGARRAGFVTHVVRLPAEVDQTLGLAVVQPLQAEPSLQPDGDIRLSGGIRSQLLAAVAAFGTDPDAPVTFVPSPETVAALAGTGEPLDAELLGELGAMLDAGSVPASPFVPLDVDALVDAQLEGDTLGAQLGRGAETLRSLAGIETDSSTWIADTTLGPTGLEALGGHGVDHVVVPHASLDGAPNHLLVQPFLLTAGDVEANALATDPGLQSHHGSTGSSVLDAQHLLADLAAIWFERPAYSRATVVVLPDSAAQAYTTTLLGGIADSPLLDPGTVPDVIAGSAPAAVGGIDSSVDGPEDRLVLSLSEPIGEEPDLGPLRDQTARTRRAMASFSSVFGATDRLDEYETRIAVSTARSLSPTGRAAYHAAIRADIDAQLELIDMPERAAITLPSRDGVIPVTLVNNTGAAAQVAIQLESDKLEFLDGDRIEHTLEEQFTSIEIRVRARASGAFPLRMSLETPDGAIQLVDSRYTVRSTAVSGLGIALSLTAVVVLAAWWIRTARRARAEHRRRSEVAEHEPT